MRLSNVVRLYRVRLRSRLAQELFALSGIAVGVALLFASQVASTSLSGSVRQITAGIVGPMRFQLAARAPQGFDERLLGEVRSLPGIAAALPVLEARVNIVGPAGARTVDLLGANPQLARLAGPLMRRFGDARLADLQALAVPAPIAQAVGVTSLRSVRLQIGSLEPIAFVGMTLTAQDIGPLADSPIALGPLRYVQQLAGMPGRVTSIFVRPRPGDEREVRAGLGRVAAANGLNLRPADFEATLFSQAASPTNQSTLLFSTISALVGFLFAFNALLLTVAQRRNLVEDLRLDGYTAGMIVRVLLFDALVLGLLASLVGLALGELLSVELFSASPGYLSLGFPVGSQRIVTWQSVAVALAGGVAAAVVGVLAPLRREIFLPLSSAFAGPARSAGSVVAALVAGLACLAGTTAILFAAPQAAVVGVVSLIVALLLFLPVALTGVVAVLARLRRFFSGVSPYLAVIELRSRANRARALAISATGAIAVFGSVAIQGAHSNLQQGLDRLVHQLNTNAQLWVIPPGEDNLLATAPFRGVDVAALSSVPGVSAVEQVMGGLLDYDARRVWVLGAPPGAAEPIPPSQLLSGGLATAAARVRAGGWAVVSQALANEHHLHVGERFVLPSPHPTAFRVAALITNLGWPPGAVILSSADYARAWGSGDPSAYYVKLAPGVAPQRARVGLERALGPRSGLGVETSHRRELRQRSASRQGLARLTQISWLVLIAAVLAMGAAMGSMIWQRRVQLADLKVDGFRRGELWRSLLLESGLLLGTGCSIGAAFGIYGQILLSHALATVTGFPVVFSAQFSIALSSFLIVTAVAVAIVALPGHVAARARPAISLQE
jgi:putative ABC transport system permease protein